MGKLNDFCRAFPSEAAVQVGLIPEAPVHMQCLLVAHAAASVAQQPG